jgi:hypothetical protein
MIKPIRRIKSLFTDHPKSIGETYIQHGVEATKVSLFLLISSFTIIIHAIFPFIRPPFGTDILSLSEYLNSKTPGKRAEHRQKNET